jgi:glucuronate isomerase
MTDDPYQGLFLTTPLARQLYCGCAAELPIIDYHCHLSAADLAADRRFETLTDVWIAADPYKHRAMRIAGVPEALITGRESSPREKFDAWAATVPKTVGSPLYHWSALELARVFGVGEPLSSETADAVWAAAGAQLSEPGLSARGLLSRFRVACVCTSDGALDDLSFHRALAQSGAATKVLPSLRMDEAVMAGDEGFAAWARRLGASVGVAVATCDDYLLALRKRLDAFGELGCRLADHALDALRYEAADEGRAARLFARCLAGQALSAEEATRLRSALLRFLGLEYGRRGWIMQLHMGAQRRTSARLRRLAGPAGGYAAIGAACDVGSLCRFLDDLEQGGALPRTILYTLNPADSAVLATLTGSYAEDGVAGKVQFGPAWWYNDHALGIRQHLEALANYGLLSTFIGMTTDSRSLLSFVRHEYFRRVLCGTLGEWAQRGLVPEDIGVLEPLVQAVCYGNAKEMVKW